MSDWKAEAAARRETIEAKLKSLGLTMESFSFRFRVHATQKRRVQALTGNCSLTAKSTGAKSAF